MNNANREIPIFFSTDDHYIPFLDVAIRSLIANASRAFSYRLIVLNTGLDAENVRLVKQNEEEGFTIDFVDISEQVEQIKSRFKNVYHFSVVTYYRLFIASLFPQYDKVIYLDCDLVVLGDISKMYAIDMGENIIAAGPEQFVRLITEYDFDLLDPDQAYLNYLCYGTIYPLPNGWNKEPMPVPCEGEKGIVHYALYKKPWQYDDVIDGEYFWQYAEQSPFCGEIRRRRESFGEAERREKEETAVEILEHALKIVESDVTFAKKFCKK